LGNLHVARLAAFIANGRKTQTPLLPHPVMMSKKRVGEECTDGVDAVFHFLAECGLQCLIAFADLDFLQKEEVAQS
jgi:hypothetical protein